MASKRWCNPAARKLLAELRVREARQLRWDDVSPSNILAEMNDALRNVYDAGEWWEDLNLGLPMFQHQPVPQSILLSYPAYMILRGYSKVKLGRRHHKWVRM